MSPPDGGRLVRWSPGNVQTALDASDRSAFYRAATYVRLPVQVPLVVWAVQVARFSRPSSG